MVIGFVIFGYHHDAGRAFVKAMDDPRPQNAIDSGQILAVIKERIHQGARGVTRGGMDHHSCGLVDDDDGRVFIKDRDGERLGFDWKRLGLGKDAGNEIPCFHMGPGLRGLVVEQNGSFFYQSLHLRTSEAEFRISHELIKTSAMVLLGNPKDERLARRDPFDPRGHRILQKHHFP
jgi:hypothetical protein